ncbi:MAG: hypothetical protein ACJATA_001000 [Sphingobacteriales bacterium]|jgi:hypothetical protein
MSLKSFLNNHSNAYLLLIFHWVVFWAGLWFFHLWGNYEIFPIEFHLDNWDVDWYKMIVEDGYSFAKGQQSNVAFYPLFPLVWKSLGSSLLGISIFNLLIFNSALLIFWKTFKLKAWELLNLVAIPSLFFCFIPYSEALFFLGGAILLGGLKKEKLWMLALGLFICGITRSVSVIFVPIIFGVYLLSSNKENWKINSLRFLGLSTLLLALNWLVHRFLVAQSGVEFTTYELQKAWNKVLAIPQLPLTTWGGRRLVWLDGISLFVGFSTLIWLLKKGWNKFENLDYAPKKSRVFSFSYLFLVTIITLLFAVSNGNSTSVYSLNRYIFATPFFSIFLLSVWRIEIPWKPLLKIFGPLFFIVCAAFYRLPEAPNFWEAVVRSLEWIPYFIGMFAYAALFVLPKYWKSPWSSILLYVVNLGIGLWLFTEFLSGAWVG